MVITPDFLWLHIPKMGGTSFRVMCMKIQNYTLYNPVADTDFKGNNLINKHQHLNADLSRRIKKHFDVDTDNLKIVMNLRPLPEWVISHTCFMKINYGHVYDNADIKKGLLSSKYYTATADTILKQYNYQKVDYWMRTNNLNNDFLDFIKNFKQLSEEENESIKKVGKALYNRHYQRNIYQWYTLDEIENLYANNPIYTELERKLYGKLAHEK